MSRLIGDRVGGEIWLMNKITSVWIVPWNYYVLQINSTLWVHSIAGDRRKGIIAVKLSLCAVNKSAGGSGTV